MVQLPADTLGMMESPGVSGTYAIDAALEALLDGTALAATRSGSTITIDVRGVRESVEVTGRLLPRVESPKYATTLSATPQTIQVIPQAAMSEQGSFTLSDAMRNVPGITLQAGEGGGASGTAGDMFNMRGFSAANSLFVDNVRDDGLITRDVFNLEQVEVYLGPTGSDVGRGNAAGYVNMTTKTPQLGSTYSGALTYGTADAVRATADVNVQLPAGEPGSWLAGTALRVNAMWQDGGVAGRDYAENERRAIAPSLALGLGTPTRITVSGQFTRQDNVPDYGIPGAAWTELLTPTSVLTSRPVDQENYYGSPDVDFDHAEQTSVTARLDQDLAGNWSLRNQTRYNDTSREAVITAIQSPTSYVPETETVIFGRQVNFRENAIFANQTTLTGRVITGALSHSLTAGVELVGEDYSAPGMGGGGTRAPESIYDPNPFATITGYAPAPTGATTDATTRTIAVSGFDVVNIGKLQLSGGLRVENYDTEFRSLAVTGIRTDVDAADTVVSGKAGVLYQVTPTLNAYVSYGSTVTPPGSGNFALSTQPNNANNPNVDPQVSRNFEVGGKWDLFQRRLSANLALFDTRNENVIYTIDATTVPPLFNQDDEQHVQGATVGLVGQITDHWSVMANFAYIDGKQNSQNIDLDGMRLTLLPERSGSLWTTYKLPFGVEVGGGVRYVGERFTNVLNARKVEAYVAADATLGYEFARDFTLRLNAFNLFDKRFADQISGGHFVPGPGRSVLATLSIRR